MVEERSGSNHTNEKSFIQMLKEKSNWINLLIIVFAWSVTGYSYYWVAFYVKYFNGSIYINAFLFGLAELIGVFIFSFLIKYFKNKTLFIGLFFLSFIGSICYCLTRTYTDLVPIWILLMAISFSMLFSLVYYANCSFFSSEYSTRIFSICNVVSRSFTILAPMSVETFSNPIIFVCMLSLFLSLISFLLKESEQSKSEGE